MNEKKGVIKSTWLFVSENWRYILGTGTVLVLLNWDFVCGLVSYIYSAITGNTFSIDTPTRIEIAMSILTIVGAVVLKRVLEIGDIVKVLTEVKGIKGLLNLEYDFFSKTKKLTKDGDYLFNLSLEVFEKIFSGKEGIIIRTSGEDIVKKLIEKEREFVWGTNIFRPKDLIDHLETYAEPLLNKSNELIRVTVLTVEQIVDIIIDSLIYINTNTADTENSMNPLTELYNPTTYCDLLEVQWFTEEFNGIVYKDNIPMIPTVENGKRRILLWSTHDLLQTKEAEERYPFPHAIFVRLKPPWSEIEDYGVIDKTIIINFYSIEPLSAGVKGRGITFLRWILNDKNEIDDQYIKVLNNISNSFKADPNRSINNCLFTSFCNLLEKLEAYRDLKEKLYSKLNERLSMRVEEVRIFEDNEKRKFFTNQLGVKINATTNKPYIPEDQKISVLYRKLIDYLRQGEIKYDSEYRQIFKCRSRN